MIARAFPLTAALGVGLMLGLPEAQAEDSLWAELERGGDESAPAAEDTVTDDSAASETGTNVEEADAAASEPDMDAADADVFADIETDSATVADEEASGDSPLSFSLSSYASIATHDQRDLRFARRESGLAEVGHSLTLGWDDWLRDDLRFKLELHAESEGWLPLDESELRLRLGETFLHYAPTENIWIRTGNLKVPFGTSDAFPVLDVFGARYDHLWGIDQPDGQIIPSPAAQMVVTSGALKFQLAMSTAFEPDRVAPAFADHDYLIRDRAGTTITARDEPEDFRPEWVAGVSYFGEGLDLALSFGEVYEKSPVLRGVGVGSGGLQLETFHPRYSFAGLSGTKTFGSWLVRTDLGLFQNEVFFNQGFYSNPAGAPGAFESDVFRGVLGLEYAGISNTVLSLEYNRNIIADWQPGMRVAEDTESFAANARFALMDERLDLEFSAASLSDGVATVLRASADYAISDASSVSLQWVDYDSKRADGFMAPYEDADRLHLQWKTNF